MIDDQKTHIYDDVFFDYIESGSLSSAVMVCSFLNAFLNPKSVIDFGCGRGTWLKVWRQLGVRDVVGLDGDYVDEEKLHIPKELFLKTDLASPINLKRTFDLAVSLEVAEHLPINTSEAFVKSLTSHSDIVLFSAATPGQGGENHENEQTFEFWRKWFRRNDFIPYDFVRPNFQGCQSLEPWYRFNIILYVRTGSSAIDNQIFDEFFVPDNVPIKNYGNVAWRLRLTFIRFLPRRLVDYLAVWNSKLTVSWNLRKITGNNHYLVTKFSGLNKKEIRFEGEV